MYFSKKTSLFILAITALVCSRAMFFFIDDPEGPNLLIVTVMAAIMYSLSLVTYLYVPSIKTNLYKLFLGVLVQILVATGVLLYNSSTIESPSIDVSRDSAIMMVKEKYPEYQDYPSDNLPPKRVEVIKTEDGWRVGMYVEGSGLRGILRANCFLVTEKGEVTETGLFQGEGPAKSINLLTCTPKE